LLLRRLYAYCGTFLFAFAAAAVAAAVAVAVVFVFVQQDLCFYAEDENLISNINKIQITDSLIYVLDERQNTLHIFDKNGFFINKIDRFGEGPMEYLDIADFSVEDSTVYILSRTSRKINVYIYKGEFVKKYPLNEWYDFFYKEKGDNIFLYSNYSNNLLYNTQCI
jgi:hypothetical protein